MDNYKDIDKNTKEDTFDKEHDTEKEDNESQLVTMLNNIFDQLFEKNDNSYAVMLTQIVELLNNNQESINSLIEELQKLNICDILFTKYNDNIVNNKSSTLQLIELITYYSNIEDYSEIINFLLSLIPSDEENISHMDYFCKYRYIVRTFTNITKQSYEIASSLCETNVIDAAFSLVTNEMTCFDEGDIFEFPDNSEEILELAIPLFSFDLAKFFKAMMSYDLFYPERYISIIIQYFSSISKSLCVDVAHAGLDGLTLSLEKHYENVMDNIILYIGDLVHLLDHPSNDIVSKAIQFFAFIFMNDYPNIQTRCFKEGILDKIANIYENRLEECSNISDLICNILSVDELGEDESYFETLINFICAALDIGTIKMKTSLSYVFYAASLHFPSQTSIFLLENPGVTEELIDMIASEQLEFLAKTCNGFSSILRRREIDGIDMDPVIEMFDSKGVDRDFLENVVDDHPDDDEIVEACQMLIESIEQPISSDESDSIGYDCGGGFEFQIGD